MQEFSSSCERILIHQKTQETWDSMKDHSSWEGWPKLKTHQEKKIQSNWGRWEKVRHISQKKCVQSSQEKWKCIRKDKRVLRRSANSSKKDKSLSNWKNKKMQLSER